MDLRQPASPCGAGLAPGGFHGSRNISSSACAADGSSAYGDAAEKLRTHSPECQQAASLQEALSAQVCGLIGICKDHAPMKNVTWVTVWGAMLKSTGHDPCCGWWWLFGRESLEAMCFDKARKDFEDEIFLFSRQILKGLE